MITRMFFVFVGVVLSLAIPISSEARVIVKERIKHFTVSGKTGSQLSRSFSRKAPRVRRHSTLASMEPSLDVRNIRFTDSKTHCKVKSLDMIVSVVYRLPKWRNYRRASKKSQKVWDLFYAQLVRHEKQHTRIYKDFARDIERSLVRTTGKISKGCKDYEPKVMRKMERAFRRAESRHARLDRRDGYPRSRLRRLERSAFRIKR